MNLFKTLPRQPESNKDLELIWHDKSVFRMHESWFSKIDFSHDTLYHCWRRKPLETTEDEEKGYWMWLTSESNPKRKLDKKQCDWLLSMLNELGAVSEDTVQMLSLFQVHRDRVDPLRLTNPAYLYPRLF